MTVQTALDLPARTNLQAKAIQTATVKATSRLSYMDNLRVILCVLVILVHAAATYNEMDVWTFADPMAHDELTSVLLSTFLIICQSFFMGLFFFISGYFIPGSIDRKGQGAFWKDRLLRLGIPFLVYTLFLSKVPNYLNAVRNDALHISLWQYSLQNFWQEADAGPTWFLFALLGLSLGYSLWRLAASRLVRLAEKRVSIAVPRIWMLLGFAFVMAAAMFAVSQVYPVAKPYYLFGSITLMFSFFPQYVLMFLAGIVAYRQDWLAHFPARSLKFWSILAGIAAVAILPLFVLGEAMDTGMDPFFSGLGWQAITFELWIALMCVSVSMALILWLRNHNQAPSRLMAAIASSTFATYLIHPLVLVPVTYPLSFMSIHPMVKFALVSFLAIAGSFGVGMLLRKLPGLKAIL